MTTTSPRPRRKGVCPVEIRIVTPLSDEAFRRALPALDRQPGFSCSGAGAQGTGS